LAQVDRSPARVLDQQLPGSRVADREVVLAIEQ
jgi:hypothetical protein